MKTTKLKVTVTMEPKDMKKRETVRTRLLELGPAASIDNVLDSYLYRIGLDAAAVQVAQPDASSE